MAHLLKSGLVHLLMSLFLPVLIRAESAQYCQFGDASHPDQHISFCMGTHMYHNQSTVSHDLYLTMTVERPSSSSTGWTAIGLGDSMQGSLMFIIYGDPLGKEDPIVSIRRSDGHVQPTLLSQSDLAPGMDLRVVRSSWLPNGDSSSHTAWVSLVCYSCHMWPTTSISALSESQPWIWAWNPTQVFDEYTFDAHLKMHKHHANMGGWGTFYTNMKKTIIDAKSPPSLPPIRPGVASVLASSRPLSLSGSITDLATSATSFAHGIVMSFAFLLLFPAGVIGMRSGNPKSYTIHWVLQLTASVAVFIGLTLGLLKPTGRQISTLHQYVGIAVASSLGVQGLLGWWHHRRFLRLHRRTWVSHVHIWLGRLIIPVGWANVVSGLLLRGYGTGSAMVIMTIVLTCMEAMILSTWVWWSSRKRQRTGTTKIVPSWDHRNSMDLGKTFTLADETDEEDTDSEDGYSGRHEGDKMLGSRSHLARPDSPSLQEKSTE